MALVLDLLSMLADGEGLRRRSRRTAALAVASLAMSNLSSFLPRGAIEARLKLLGLVVRASAIDRPIFLRLERLDLRLAVADEPKRDRLHAAGRAGAGQLPPQHRRKREADEIIERAAGEIGVDQRLVDGARVRDGLEHGVFGDGVEHDPLAPACRSSAFLLQHFEHMPGDGLALAVGVGGEDETCRRL